MKATGIVRRMDDLGRVVVPKEIRRALHMCEGDALEIYTDNFNNRPVVCLAKYDLEATDTEEKRVDATPEQVQPTGREPYQTITVNFDQDGSTIVYKLDKNSYDLFVDLYNRGFLHYDLNWDEGNSIEEVSFY